MFDLEPRRTHLYAQFLGFVAPGNCAAIVVGQHDNWTADQGRAEDALARDVEIVAVDEGEHVRSTR